jgi:hypothetical protein
MNPVFAFLGISSKGQLSYKQRSVQSYFNQQCNPLFTVPVLVLTVHGITVLLLSPCFQCTLVKTRIIPLLHHQTLHIQVNNQTNTRIKAHSAK